MAAAASPSLCGMEERDARGEGPWSPGQPSSPGWGRAAGAGRGSWALRSRGTQNPPLSQLPIASPLPMVLLLAALSAIKKQGPSWLPVSSCCQILGGRVGILVLLLVKASLDQYSHVTYQHTDTHTHTQSTCAGMTQLGSWEAGGTENL